MDVGLAPVRGGCAGAAPPEVRAAKTLDRLNTNECVAFLDELAVLGDNGGNRAAHLSLDFIEDFHRLNDADRLAGLERIADLDERIRIGRGRAVEHACEGRHHRHCWVRCGGAGRCVSCSGSTGGRSPPTHVPALRCDDKSIEPAPDIDAQPVFGEIQLADVAPFERLGQGLYPIDQRLSFRSGPAFQNVLERVDYCTSMQHTARRISRRVWP